MIHGFKPDLTCEGIIEDGCGEGRIFTVQDNMLKVYEPKSKEIKVLVECEKKCYMYK